MTRRSFSFLIASLSAFLLPCKVADSELRVGDRFRWIDDKNLSVAKNRIGKLIILSYCDHPKEEIYATIEFESANGKEGDISFFETITNHCWRVGMPYEQLKIGAVKI